MISFELPKKAQALLKQLSAQEGKSENDIAFEALMERIEDFHDVQIITERMKDEDQSRIPLEEVEKRFADLEKGRRAAE